MRASTRSELICGPAGRIECAVDLPVVVVPGADHFFRRRLHILRAIIQNGWK